MSDKTFNVVLILFLVFGISTIVYFSTKSDEETKQEQEQEQEKVQVMIDKENETICYYTSQWGQCLWVDVSK